MNKQMTDLEEMKKAIEVKEEEASSVLEQDKTRNRKMKMLRRTKV